MNDDIAKFNKERWEELAAAGVIYASPFLNMDPETARQLVDPDGKMGEIDGANVLCLAAGGGQQSAAFAILGAQVTVFDISEVQLERDREAACHYGCTIQAVQGDMRDLSSFPDAAFDIVWHGHSLNYIPNITPVFDELRRVLRPGGRYLLECIDPRYFAMSEHDWTGDGYLIRRYLQEGEEEHDEHPWRFRTGDVDHSVSGPREFQHTLPTLVNGLIERDFLITHIDVIGGDLDFNAPPATWPHFYRTMRPYLRLCASLRPGILAK